MGERSGLSHLDGSIGISTRMIATSSAAAEVAIFANDLGASIQITEAAYVPDTAVTGANTNYFALALQNKGTAGSGTTALTTTKSYTNGVDIAAMDMEVFTLSTTEANLVVTAGSVISIKKTIGGSGMITPAGLVCLKFKFV